MDDDTGATLLFWFLVVVVVVDVIAKLVMLVWPVLLAAVMAFGVYRLVRWDTERKAAARRHRQRLADVDRITRTAKAEMLRAASRR